MQEEDIIAVKRCVEFMPWQGAGIILKALDEGRLILLSGSRLQAWLVIWRAGLSAEDSRQEEKSRVRMFS